MVGDPVVAGPVVAGPDGGDADTVGVDGVHERVRQDRRAELVVAAWERAQEGTRIDVAFERVVDAAHDGITDGFVLRPRGGQGPHPCLRCGSATDHPSPAPAPVPPPEQVGEVVQPNSSTGLKSAHLHNAGLASQDAEKATEKTDEGGCGR